MRRFRYYLLNSVLFSNSKCLTNLQSQPDRIVKFTRFRLFMNNYTFTVRHKKGLHEPAYFFPKLEPRADVEKSSQNEEQEIREQEHEKCRQPSQGNRLSQGFRRNHTMVFRSNTLEDNILYTQDIFQPETLRKAQKLTYSSLK